MNMEQEILDSITYYRYRGASLKNIDQYTGIRLKVNEFETKRDRVLESLKNQKYIIKHGKLWFVHPRIFKEKLGDYYPPEYEDNDFIILLAVLGGKQGQELTELIGTMDFINRAIPTFEELYTGLNRLKSSKLISYRVKRFFPSSKTQDFYNKIKIHCKKSVYDQYKGLLQMVKCPCCGVKLKKVSWTIDLTEEEVQDAIKKYLSYFNKKN